MTEEQASLEARQVYDALFAGDIDVHEAAHRLADQMRTWRSGFSYAVAGEELSDAQRAQAARVMELSTMYFATRARGLPDLPF